MRIDFGSRNEIKYFDDVKTNDPCLGTVKMAGMREPHNDTKVISASMSAPPVNIHRPNQRRVTVTQRRLTDLTSRKARA
jgi:hypothetical protein